MDGINAPQALAQHSDNDYGKVIHINVQAGAAQHLSKGHRNMQGITVDTDRQLWVVEHGPRSGGELNRIVRGNDYGWPSEI